VIKSTEISAGETKHETVDLERTVPMTALGYYSGDAHLHFSRRTEADDQIIFDLLQAEDVQFGSVLAYNEPPGTYTGAMKLMESPQFLGLGKASVPRPRRDMDRLRPGISRHNVRSSQCLLA
jgi:hypothetical protein